MGGGIVVAALDGVEASWAGTGAGPSSMLPIVWAEALRPNDKKRAHGSASQERVLKVRRAYRLPAVVAR
jgi:hypothetical protein